MIFTDYGKSLMWLDIVGKANAFGATLSIVDSESNELALVLMPNPIQQSITGGKLVFNTIPKSLVLRSGTPVLAHMIIGSVIAFSLTVGVDLILEKPSLQAGGYLNIESLSITI